MSVSMGQLVNDAKELVMRLKEREKNVDQVVVQSNALAKKVDAIQQLENEFINLNEKGNHRSKVDVLSSIQKENKVIKLLQQENEELKESLKEHQSVLEFIMAKYREQMLKLVQLKREQELCESVFKSALSQTLQDKISQISEMTEVMQKSIEMDDKNANAYEERLTMLEIENQGLKELLKIKNIYGVNAGAE
ncbi:FGFR1 oncogene partner 2 [Brachionus plicatilis]|uniref:FGFR1 oncogene partner 2 n=1 Tax=Brachionus plicatilis TaxID=10195 RepID=A0A3M7QWR6_BRAPC|nr:FGFR1 oncogene partner 2 [Brachionus plicatilis]